MTPGHLADFILLKAVVMLRRNHNRGCPKRLAIHILQRYLTLESGPKPFSFRPSVRRPWISEFGAKNEWRDERGGLTAGKAKHDS